MAETAFTTTGLFWKTGEKVKKSRSSKYLAVLAGLAFLIIGSLTFNLVPNGNPQMKPVPGDADVPQGQYPPDGSLQAAADDLGLSVQMPEDEGVDNRPSDEPLTMVTLKNGKAGLANPAGKVVLKTPYDWIGKFHDGRAVVEVYGDEKDQAMGNVLCGYIDPRGELVIPLRKGAAFPFSEGLAPFRDDRYGFCFIDVHGTAVIPPKYVDAEGFSDGVAQVREGRGSSWFYIDHHGHKTQKTYDKSPTKAPNL